MTITISKVQAWVAAVVAAAGLVSSCAGLSYQYFQLRATTESLQDLSPMLHQQEALILDLRARFADIEASLRYLYGNEVTDWPTTEGRD